MEIQKPDLSTVDSTVRAYIEALEAENERLRVMLAAAPSRSRARSASQEEQEDFDSIANAPEPTEPSEPPTTINVISFTSQGIAKRTPRHLYFRQRRGGMGVFDIETPGDEPPAVLALADESQHLLLFTDQARAFRVPVSAIPETPVRGRAEGVIAKLTLNPDEKLVAALPDQAQGYVAMVTGRGNVRLLRHHVFGEYMKPGTSLYDPRALGLLAGACWTQGDGDLFIATRLGRGIRFPEKLVPPQGGLGIRLSDGDDAVAITAVYDDSSVFLVGADGKGTIRLMEGFAANKAPGAGGKTAFASDDVIAAYSVNTDDDIFVISKTSKIIRFQAEDVPAKEGVVQGVICMSFRNDRVAAAVSSPRNLLH